MQRVAFAEAAPMWRRRRRLECGYRLVLQDDGPGQGLPTQRWLCRYDPCSPLRSLCMFRISMLLLRVRVGSVLPAHDPKIRDQGRVDRAPCFLYPRHASLYGCYLHSLRCSYDLPSDLRSVYAKLDFSATPCSCNRNKRTGRNLCRQTRLTT